MVGGIIERHLLDVETGCCWRRVWRKRRAAVLGTLSPLLGCWQRCSCCGTLLMAVLVLGRGGWWDQCTAHRMRAGDR